MQTPPSRKLAPRQESLRQAHQVAKMALGQETSTVMAERSSGIYRGVIIGHTRDYIVQQIANPAAAAIHSKHLFRASEAEFPWPEVGHAVSIHYSGSHAIAREIRERAREQGLSR